MDRHAHHQAGKRRELRRRAFDIVLVLLFLIAIGGALGARVLHGRDEHAAYLREREDALREELLRKEREHDRSSVDADPSAAPSSGTDTPLLVQTSQEDAVRGLLPPFASNTSTDVALDTHDDAVLGYVRFEDVTVTRYQNDRLGFVIELPANWPLAYERHDSVAFADAAYPAGITDERIAERAEAMWLRVRRPCESTEATTTLFRFATTSVASVREASACVAPFLVTLGYRADVPDRFGRERFLLSVARTLYPLVQSSPPYLPLR